MYYPSPPNSINCFLRSWKINTLWDIRIFFMQCIFYIYKVYLKVVYYLVMSFCIKKTWTLYKDASVEIN